MRTILLIATGGTIASRPTAAGGLAPAITSQELLSCVPELAEFCRIDAIQLYNLDSTNMGPEQWQGIAAAVQENYDRYDGFVITHGTDTMGYTAAALSYMIRKSPKPVVLTGSQKSIYNRDTDARNNLWRAVAYACHPDAWGVQIVFDNKVILGTRARKTRTKSFNAFSSIDYPETAMFRDRRLDPVPAAPGGVYPCGVQYCAGSQRVCAAAGAGHAGGYHPPVGRPLPRSGAGKLWRGRPARRG